VFLTAALTYTAYRLVLAARPSRPGMAPGSAPGRHAGAPKDES
jgi:hypothetical protein